MSNNPNDRRERPVNFNTVLHFIVMGAIGWVSYSINEGSKKLSTLSERMVAIETSNSSKIDQLNRMESEMARQRQSLFELQLDVSKMKNPSRQ